VIGKGCADLEDCDQAKCRLWTSVPGALGEDGKQGGFFGGGTCLFRLLEFDLIDRAGIEPALEAEPLPAHSLLPSLPRGRMCLYSLVWVYNLCHLGIGIQRGRETKSPGLVGGWGDQVPMTREVSDKCQGVVWQSWDKLTAYVDLQHVS
jgi:hypothetical protein